jgi:hypothetical protein
MSISENNRSIRRRKRMKTVRSTANKVDVYHIVRFSEGRQKMIVNNLILLCTSYQAEEYKGEHAYYILKGDENSVGSEA